MLRDGKNVLKRPEVRALGLAAGMCMVMVSLTGCALSLNKASLQSPLEVSDLGPTASFSYRAYGEQSGDGVPVGVVVGSIPSPGSSLRCVDSGNNWVSYQGGTGICTFQITTPVWGFFGFFRSDQSTLVVPVNRTSVAPVASATASAATTTQSSPSVMAPAPAAAASSAAPQAAPAPSAAQPSPKSTASKSASASASTAPSTAAAAPSTPSLSAQTVTWNPTTAISTTTASSYGGREFTPSTRATTSGNGAITYSVGSPNTSYCRVEGERTIVVGGNGVCTVIATAAATSQYSQGSTSVTFTISNWTDPRPAAPASSSPPVF